MAQHQDQRGNTAFSPTSWGGKDSVMNLASTKSSSSPKWILFGAFILTVPVPYFMVVVGGIVPTFLIIFIAVQGLVVALPKFTAEGFWMLGILWSHVVILGGLLYLAACGITRLLFHILPHRYAVLVEIGLIAALFVASTFEIYRMPGHNSSPPANILRIVKSLAT
jgi:hypothetical protein